MNIKHVIYLVKAFSQVLLDGDSLVPVANAEIEQRERMLSREGGREGDCPHLERMIL